MDVQRTIADRVWSLLLASDTVSELVTEGRRIRTDEEQWEKRDAALMQSSRADDFPNLRVLVTGGSGPAVAGLMSYDCEYPIPDRVDVEIRLGAYFKHDANLMVLEAAIQAALWSEGPCLGLDTLVRQITRRKTRTFGASRETGGNPRAVIRWNWSVETEVYPSDLLT